VIRAIVWQMLHAALVAFSVREVVRAAGLARGLRALAWIVFVAVIGEAWGLRRGLFGARYAYDAGRWFGLGGLALPVLVPLVWFAIAAVSHGLARAVVADDERPLATLVTGAAIMTAWDLALDPLAVELGLWSWRGGTPVAFGIPLENALAWMLGGLVCQLGLVGVRASARSLAAFAGAGMGYAWLADTSSVRLLVACVFVLVTSLALVRVRGHGPGAPRALPIVRKPSFDVANVGRYWAGGSATKTHFYDAINVAVMVGERYMIRNVAAASKLVRSGALRGEMRAFNAQEAQHARQHEALMERRREPFHADAIAWCRALDRALTRFVSLRWNLAISAGIEHLTASVATLVLDHRLLRDADAPARSLFEWHMAEELEHRSVVFDVMTALGCGYARRVGGLAVGIFVLGGLLAACTSWFLVCDGCLLRRSTWRDARRLLFTRDALLLRATPLVAGYLGLDFHPSRAFDDRLAPAVRSSTSS
jgi:predicted metal-dependent hydrolase/uncharacterized membrane protein